MDGTDAGGRRVITEAPPGNRPGETRELELTNCVPERKGKPHAWEVLRDGFGEPTGKMFCLFCRKRALMKKSVGMFVQEPHCARTGY